MGNSFEIKIGMTTQQVMANINKMNTTPKTKQAIIDFCNNDQDKIITNEIELTMLDSWSKGSEKINMPIKGKGNKPVHTETFSDGTVISYWESLSNKSIIGSQNDNYDRLVLDGRSANWSNNSSSDELIDLDGDGYADSRKYKPDSFKINSFKEDTNLDGKWDDTQKKSRKGNFTVNPNITFN